MEKTGEKDDPTRLLRDPKRKCTRIKGYRAVDALIQINKGDAKDTLAIIESAIYLGTASEQVEKTLASLKRSTFLGKKCKSSITKDHFNKWKKTTGNIKSFNKQKPGYPLALPILGGLFTILLLHKAYSYLNS